MKVEAVHNDMRFWPEVDASRIPTPTDIAVVTTLGDKRVGVHPIHEYNDAYRRAGNASGRGGARAELVPIDTRQLLALSGKTPEQFIASLDSATLLELRHLAIDACVDALRYCNDPAVRADASGVLVKLGVI